MSIKNCPVCLKTEFSPIFYSDRLPKYNLTYALTFEEAMAIERVAVKFVHCQNCDFLFNQIYTQLDYKESSYDASRIQSQVIVSYYNAILSKIKPYLGEVNHAVEVGAGDCYFSELVAKQIGASVSAYDPTFSAEETKNDVKKYRSYYDKSRIEKPDLVFFRHVLEHISDVRSFLENVLHETPPFVFIEIPCA